MRKSEDWDLAHQTLSAIPSARCAMCVNDLLQSWVVAVHIMYQIAFCVYTTRKKGSFYVSVKLLTYPSPEPTLALNSYLGQNDSLGRSR